MKIRHINWLAGLTVVSLLAVSCKKDSPSVDDNFLNYKIEDVPVTSNYTVGAFYTTFGSFNANVKQVPLAAGSANTYFYSNGNPATGTSANPVLTPAIMDNHVAQAATAGIDYFIFSVRSPTMETNNFKADSNTVVSFLNAQNSSKMNFALMYNLSTGTLGISNTVTLESNATKLANFYADFKRLAYFMTKANYQKVNGKYILIINNAQDLNSANNATLYAKIRSDLSALGFNLYIVGMQARWQPPQRFYYRFQNCTDAMYEANMGDYAGDPDRFYLFPQMVDQNWAYYKTTLNSWGQEFIPSVMAGYNYQINTPTSANLSVQRTADGSWYKTFTNVAKRNADKSRLIFVDSFNNFSVDSQIEATQAYGNTYLNITRQAFKVN